MRARCLTVLMSTIVLGAVSGQAHASGLRLFHRGRCEQAPVCMPGAPQYHLPLDQVSQPQEEMVTITRTVPVTRYVERKELRTFTWTEYVCQPGGRVVPVQRTGQQEVTVLVPVTETRTETVQVPASSPEGIKSLRLRVSLLEDDVKNLKRIIKADSLSPDSPMQKE